MPAYAYPIEVKYEPQELSFTDTMEVEPPLSMGVLFGFTGNNPFDTDYDEDTNLYTITVYKKRLESNEELHRRLAREEAYMAEYHKRKNKQNS